MVDASKAKQKAPQKPEPPEYDPTDDDAGRAAKWADFYEKLTAWQAAQPVLSIEAIRDAKDLNEGPLYIPEWEGNVIVRGLSREEYTDLDARCRQNGVLDTEAMGREAMTMCLVSPRIAPDEPMWKKNPMALKRIMDSILERSGVLGEVAAEVAAQFQG